MSTVAFIFILVIFTIIIVYILDKLVWGPQRKREAEAAPRITLDEVQQFWGAIEKDALPIAKAKVQERAPRMSTESRIGGAPLAICDDISWPRSADEGSPMALVAQINFAEVPPMEDFPTLGILQIFSSFDTIDDLNSCEHVIRWEPDPQTDQLLEIPEKIVKTTRDTRAFSERTRRLGLPLVFESGVALGNPFNWPYEEHNVFLENRLPENDEVAAILNDWEDRSDRIVDAYGTHWVGGHPGFVQGDVRDDFPELRHLDRVLFHLGCDKDISIGDAGELNVMISREALLQRDFQKAYVTWDCG